MHVLLQPSDILELLHLQNSEELDLARKSLRIFFDLLVYLPVGSHISVGPLSVTKVCSDYVAFAGEIEDIFFQVSTDKDFTDLLKDLVSVMVEVNEVKISV